MFILDMPPEPPSEVPVLMAQAGNGKRGGGGDVVMQDLTPLSRSRAVVDGNLSLAPLILNHFHVYVKPPVRVEIEISSNLLAATEESAPMILAAAPSLTATDVSAASAPVTANTKTQYDRVMSICSYAVSTDFSPAAIEMYNTILPAATVSMHLSNRGILWGKNEPVKITVLKTPAHGELIPNARYPEGVFIYHANQGYIGVDQMSFEVEVLGKKFKVIKTVVVQNSNPDGPTEEAVEAIKSLCPQNFKGSQLDIIELPTDGFVSDEVQKQSGETTFSRNRICINALADADC